MFGRDNFVHSAHSCHQLKQKVRVSIRGDEEHLPTASTPHICNMRNSAGVSKLGPPNMV